MQTIFCKYFETGAHRSELKVTFIKYKLAFSILFGVNMESLRLSKAEYIQIIAFSAVFFVNISETKARRA